MKVRGLLIGGVKRRRFQSWTPVCASILLALVIVTTFTVDHQQVDCKKIKLKEKKILKSLVKGLILKNLSTKKNFLPMPVPIPGKWQQILTTIIDFSLLQDKETMNQNRKFSSSLVAAAATDSSKGLKPPSPSLPTKFNLNAIKKYTRLTAAKYARRLITNEPKPSKLAAVDTASGVDDKLKKVVASISDRKSANVKPGISQHKNDPVVTLFNLVKLVQQLKELDRARLLSLTRKSSQFGQHKKSPMLSMNINNKKSFVNKMNYIYTLTSDFNHRHRQFHNGLTTILN